MSQVSSLFAVLLDVLPLPLAELGSKVGYRKSTLSVVSRYPETAGPRLRTRLANYFGIPWDLLCAPCDRDALAYGAIAQAKTKDYK